MNTAALREQESLVTQETELFDDTIENNIRIAKRDAIREEVEKSRLVPKYPRGHMGHSIGCGVGPEEYPTIAPGTDYVLEPNMVVCLETPYSGTGGAPVHGGFNLEDTHLITANGHDSFTTMPDNIFWK